MINSAIARFLKKSLHGFMLLGMLFTIPGAEVSARSGLNDPSIQKAEIQPANEIQSYSPLSASSGWVLLGGRLYFTGDNGAQWKDITPALPAAASLLAVIFLDARSGRVLSTSTNPEGNLDLQISFTSDAGLTWENRLVQTIASEDPDSYIESAGMDWLDPATGWVSIKRQTSANFSAGVLFRTDDSGLSWTRSVPPAGEPVHFLNKQVGWMAGGPARDQLLKSEDAGLTWAEQILPAGLQGGRINAVYAPIFDPAGNGLLPVIFSGGDNYEINFFTSMDGGKQWNSGPMFPLGPQNGNVPLSLLTPQQAVATVPGSSRILQLADGRVNSLTNQDGMSADIADLQMLSPDLGWARWNKSTCTKQASTSTDGVTDINCTSSTSLIRTINGGLTWDAILLPAVRTKTLVQSSSASSSSPSQVRAASAVNTQILIGKGFDICGIPRLTEELDVWDDYSPYIAMNIYIGGAARAHGCDFSRLNAAYLVQARAIGWTFIPTWVGPQAPCTSFIKRFSPDVNQAFLDGVNEANLAIDTLSILGLTTANKKGSIVYYDLETFVGDQACRDAVKSFMNGWDYQLKTTGNLSGIYGSTGCTNGLNNYINLPYPPDAMWAAIWDYHATLWNIGCIPNTAWANHQRIHQYTGGVNETWGGVTLNIDNDILDGIVAVPNQVTIPPPPSAIFTASPLSGNAPLEVTFNLAKTANIATCSWVYGDGETGTSCAASHKHIYNTSESYSVTLTVMGPGGSDDLTRPNYISVTEKSALPDLIPYPHGAGVDPVIISSLPSTSVNDTLYADRQIFIDWGFKNISSASINTGFKVDLYIDSQRIIDFPLSGLGALSAGGYADFSMTWNVSGWHTVRLIVDPDNTVVESNEANNSWSGQFYWESPPTIWPTILAPTGIISTNKPDFRWTALPLTVASHYAFYLNSLIPGGISFSNSNIPNSTQYCNGTTCTMHPNFSLPPGDYQFRVGGNDSSSFSPWQVFTVSGVPVAPSILSPSGTVPHVNPTYSWSKSTSASWYELYVYPEGSSTTAFSQTSIPALSTCTATTCTWNSAPALGRGNYEVKLRAANLSGVSDFSVGSFNVDADLSKIFLPLIVR